MPDRAPTTYDAVPYTSYPYPQTHPDRLCTLARLFGMSAAHPTGCRVLELGCATGGNLIPMADHYLYFPLLGLLGAVAFALREPLGKALARPRAPLAAGCVVLLLGGAFAVKSHARARVWRSPVTLALDSATHYPDGLAAHLLRANRAARQGDVDTSVLEMRGALARGYDRFLEIDQSENFAAVRHAPAFRELIGDMAGAWLALSLTLEEPTQEELYMRAQAHLARGELDSAIAAIEQALARGGPFEAGLRAQLALLRRAQRAASPNASSMIE